MIGTNYDQCHTSYRGYMDEEIDAAREMLKKYGKPCPDAVKELRLKTNMPMSECGTMLRCLWRDVELERVQSENEKLRRLATYALKHIIEVECEGKSCERCTKRSSSNCPRIMPWMFDVSGIEVDR